MKIIIFLFLLFLVGCTSIISPKPVPVEKQIPIPATVRGHGDEIKNTQ